MRICESEFRAFIRGYGKVLYLCHRNADPDAIGSAFALIKAFGGTLGAVNDLSRTGEALANAIGAEVKIDPSVEDYDLIVVVDTSVRLQLGNINLGSYGVIDHHLDEGLLEDALFYIQKPTKSAAEIVWMILKESRVKPTKEMALGLMVGMISDTGRFKRATSNAFQAASELLDDGGFDYEEALQILSIPTDISRKIAVLKAASRAKIDRQKDWLIATTKINSFEGSAAMALVDLGADVAFAAGKHGEITRISARAGREVASKGLNLAEILREVAQANNGEGGGHRAAASLEAKGEPCTLLDKCKKRTSESLP
jgi:bifunctional oligoribonuclease and PAP phosphatase NrnA